MPQGGNAEDIVEVQGVSVLRAVLMVAMHVHCPSLIS